MLSSMSPSILSKNGKLFMVTGSPGGRTIINTVLETMVNAIDYGMSARAVVDEPRLDHEWLPDRVSFEKTITDSSMIKSLTAMGHQVRVGGEQGDAEVIMMKGKVAYG